VKTRRAHHFFRTACFHRGRVSRRYQCQASSEPAP
jgi:hypothetical protein